MLLEARISGWGVDLSGNSSRPAGAPVPPRGSLVVAGGCGQGGGRGAVWWWRGGGAMQISLAGERCGGAAGRLRLAAAELARVAVRSDSDLAEAMDRLNRGERQAAAG